MSQKMDADPIEAKASGKYILETLALKDVRRLIQAGILHGTVAGTRDYIARSSRYDGVRRYVWWYKPFDKMLEAEPLLLVELYPGALNPQQFTLQMLVSSLLEEGVVVEPASRDSESVSSLESAWRQGRLLRDSMEELRQTLEKLWVDPLYSCIHYYVREDSQRKASDLLVAHAMPALEDPKRIDFADLLDSLGFRPGGQLKDYFKYGKVSAHAHILSRRREELLKNQIFFLPFAFGAIVVQGNQSAVRSVYFLSKGAQVENLDVIALGYRLGLMDEEGFLLDAIQRQDFWPEIREEGAMALAQRELADYLSGKRTTFSFPLFAAEGTEFQKRIWKLIAEIPYGRTKSYLELARRLVPDDEKKAHNLCRAVGAACGANPLCIVVPCHRVIGNDMSLTGFSGGVHFKARLLDMELLGLRTKETLS